MTGITLFLLQSMVIVVLPYLIWGAFRLKNIVPLVVIQLALGIIVGPSILKNIHPELFDIIFYSFSLSSFSEISAIAILLFSFITGLHLEDLRNKNYHVRFVGVGIVGIVFTLLFGSLAGYWIHTQYPSAAGEKASEMEFSLSIGICVAVTALPVLSAILREARLIHTNIGQVSLRLAAINDICLWIFLILLGSNVKTNAYGLEMLGIFASIFVYFATLLGIFRPSLERIFRNAKQVGDGTIVGIFCIVIVSAFVTETLGLHYIIGGFLVGAIIPMNAKSLTLPKLECVITVILMPFFFVITGLKTHIDLKSEIFLQTFALVSIVAVFWKIIGISLPAKLLGISWGEAIALGALMQTKGLMEIVVLTVLLDVNIISQHVFSALVVMALVSTALAMPLTRTVLVWRKERVSFAGSKEAITPLEQEASMLGSRESSF